MVGMVMVAPSWGDRAAGLLDSARSSAETARKLGQLRKLREVLLHRDPSLLPDFAPRLAAELQADRSSPARRFLAEMIGEIGSKRMELLPEMLPTLISFLKDETPAVARQAITSGTFLFRNVLEKVAFQGIYSSEIDDSLKGSWSWMLNFKNAVLPVAVQSVSDGVRLLAIRFIEAMILLYTPDPDILSDPPLETDDGMGFNISWIKGRHSFLNVGDLTMEASHSLTLLLDQLRFLQVKSISNSIVIVLINSLSNIAKKRPSFYGRILPVLLSLDPMSSVIKGVQVPGAYHALKSSFMAFLKCTHSSAAPWRIRLVEALKTMNAGDLVEEAYNLNKISGSIGEDRTCSLQVCDEEHVDLGRKRHITEDNSYISQDGDVSKKRIRSVSPIQETAKESPRSVPYASHNNLPSFGSSTRDGDSGPVQQLVGMFGALVAQGNKASESLEILISSISSDLLAEVVMVNMRHLPPAFPRADGEEEMVPNNNHHSSVLVPDVFSLLNAFPLIVSLFDTQPSATREFSESPRGDEEKIATTADTSFGTSNVYDSIITISTSIPPSTALNPPETEDPSASPLFASNVEGIDDIIPGLDSISSFDEIEESRDASHTSISELPATSENVDVRIGDTLPLDISSGSLATSVSETLSPSTTTTDVSQPSCTTSVISILSFLPKMSVPELVLEDEQKDQLQKVAFLRILEAYKHVGASGGSHIHFPLLAHLGNEFPLELDSWGLLQKHVLSDYLNHEGHELTLRVLYRLYREVEQDQDFLSSRTATSVYESFLLTVAETLRATFPASDKSLSRLLGEVPYLSEGVLKLLECLCSPESDQKQEKDFQSGDRVTQGLSAVWNLILLRPSSRGRCLQIALQSAVHRMEEVRMKAIRLVANKLFPMPAISKQIEDFAYEKLHSVFDDTSSMELKDGDRSTPGLQKDNDLERPGEGPELARQPTHEQTSDNLSIENTSVSSVSEAKRCMSLYFALCTKKHSLLRHIFSIYNRLPNAAKEAVQRQVPILVRTIGSSPELLALISDPPNESDNLLMQVLQTLTDASAPSQDLMASIRKLYNSKMKDAEILIPVLSFLTKDEVLPIFPQLVNLPLVKFQAALTRLLQESAQAGPSLTPPEVLIAIHGIDPEKDGIPLKKVMDACSACFEQRQVFTQQVLAKVLNQLVEQIPLPLLFMRTVIQAISVYPALIDFVMEILSRLISKQIWKYQKLWVGFLKCAILTKPQSFSVLLQLPAAQLENALNKNPVLKAPLVEHANQSSIRSTLPRSTLVVLGLVNDSQASAQAQASQSQAADTGSSAADAATEVTQESTAVS